MNNKNDKECNLINIISMKNVTKGKNNQELKTLLVKLNISKDVSMDKFLEKCIYDFGLKVQMNKFKAFLFKFFEPASISMSQVDQIATSLSIDKNGIINLVDVIIFMYDVQEMKLINPLFIFCFVANLINEQYQCSTIEFLALNSLSIEQEININQFFYKIAHPLELTDIASIIVFKALNVNNNSKIKLFDFVNLIDSYRDENCESAAKVTMNEFSLTKREFNCIGRFCSLCLENKLSEIDIFKECAGVDALDSNAKITMDRFKQVLKLKLIRISDSEIDAIVEAFDSKNERSVTFKHYSNSINFCKYEVYSTTTQLNFAKTGLKRLNCIPVKDNTLAINQLYQEIIKSLSSKEKKSQRNNVTDNHQNGVLKDTQSESNLRAEVMKSIISTDEDEWRLTEVIEDIRASNYIYLTSYEFFGVLKKEFKDLSTEKQNSILNLIDSNKDGYISYNDLILFLLYHFNYKSTKLAWVLVEDCLNQRQLTPEEFSNKFPNEIIERDQFNTVFTKEFSLEKIIVLEMYEVLFDSVIKKYQRNMVKADIVTQIKSQRKPKTTANSKSTVDYKNQTITLTQTQLTFDSKSRVEIKNCLVNTLKGFLTIENVCAYLYLKEQITFYQFREAFIKKCNINYIEGIQLFYQLRTKSNDYVLINELKDYVNKLCVKELENIEFSMTSLLNIIDPKGNYMILCLETYRYSPNVISTLELKNHIKSFYPSLSSRLIFLIVKALDKELNGVVTYKAMNAFIFKYTKRKYSFDLMLKELSAFLEQKQYNTTSYMERVVLLNSNDLLSLNETRKLFITQLEFTKFQHQFFVSQQLTLGQLINQIKLMRITEEKEGVYYNEITEEDIERDSMIGNNDLLDIDFGDIDQYLYINPNLQISVLEFFNYIKSKNKDRLKQRDSNSSRKLKQLMLFLKKNDTNQSGMISYKRLYKLIKWKNNAKFHLQYISVWILLNFNGSLDDYLQYKNLTENRYLKRAEFSFYFEDEEMLNDATISNDIFDYFENKHNLFDVKNFLDYIKFISTEYSFSSIPESEWEELIKKEIESIELKTFKPFYSFFNMIAIENIFGRIRTQTVKKEIGKAFKDIEVNEQVMVLFVHLFCSNKSHLLFDLIKAALFVNSVSKYYLSIEKIIKTLKKSISRSNDKVLLALVNSNKGISLVEFYQVMHKQYKLASYETVLLFNDAYNHYGNQYKKTFELDMEFFYSQYNFDIKANQTLKRPMRPKKEEEEKFPSVIKPSQSQTQNQESSSNSKLKTIKSNSLSEKNRIEKRKANALKTISRFGFMIKVKSKDDLQGFFDKFDLNHNGHISRDELLSILNLFDSLNDNDKMIIINYSDNHNLDDIQIQKFINIINSIKFSEEEYEALQREINQPNKQFASVVIYSKLQSNYLKNKRKVRNISKDSIAKSLYYLQEDLYTTFNKSDTFEKDFFELSIDDSNSATITYDEFNEIIKAVLKDYNIELTTEINDELIKCAYEGVKAKKIQTYKSFKVIPYQTFITYVANYEIKEAPQEAIASKKMESLMKIQNKLDKKFENRNKQFNELFHKKFQKQIDVNKTEDVVELKNVLLDTFCFSQQAIKGIQDKNIFLFKKFLTEISEGNYTEFPYELKDDDYFKRSDGKIITTILNNESAALKKCELLYKTLRDKEMFFDTDFGSLPKEEDIQDYSGKKSIYYNMTPNGQIDAKMIGWYRLNEISKNPQFLCKEPHSSEVVQGALGNCWFISALAAIATKDHLIRGEFDESILDDGIIDDEEALMLSSGVYPPLFHYFRKKNIFCFRFFKNLSWKYVIIDDRMPCIKRLNNNQTLKVIYGKCRNSNEFWVSLIEKAYAKLHGCYEAITSGCTDDGIMDLTGQVSKRSIINLFENPETVGKYIWDLFESNLVTPIEKRSLHRKQSILEKQIQSVIISKNNSIVVCEIEASTNRQEIRIDQENSGILVNHAYIILNTFTITRQKGDKTKISRIMRMKNPWGFKTWSGKWGINSEEYEKHKNLLQKELKRIDSNSDILDPGTFFMCFSDFLKIFTKLYFGIQLYPSYIGYYFNETCTSALQTALPYVNQELFFNSPQYYLQVKNKTKLFIQLIQSDGRMEYSHDTCFPFDNSLLRTIIVAIKTEGKQRINVLDQKNIVKISPIRLHRDNSIEGLFESGEYIIIPCNCDTGKEGLFKLIFYVLDTFVVAEVDDTNFADKFTNTYVERLKHEKEADISLVPCLIKENTKKAIQETREEKKNILFYQLKKALTMK